MSMYRRMFRCDQKVTREQADTARSFVSFDERVGDGELPVRVTLTMTKEEGEKFEVGEFYALELKP